MKKHVFSLLLALALFIAVAPQDVGAVNYDMTEEVSVTQDLNMDVLLVPIFAVTGEPAVYAAVQPLKVVGVVTPFQSANVRYRSVVNSSVRAPPDSAYRIRLT